MTAPAPARPYDARPPCPVCRHLGPAAERCPQCDWVLTAGPWAGHATAEHQRAFDDRLLAARRAVDLRAAVRASGFVGPGGPAVPERLAACVRGGPATGYEIDRVHAELTVTASRPSPDDARVVGTVMRRLTEGGPACQVGIVELTFEGVSTVAMRGGHDGVPEATAAVHSRPWVEILPALPDDPLLARFILAGGIGTFEAVPALDMADAVAAVLRALPGQVPLLLVDRVSGRLELVVRLVTALQEVARGHGRDVDVAGLDATEGDLLDLLAAFTPLRRALGLVVVHLDGSVPRPVVHPLFPQGASRAMTAPAEVTVTGPAAAGQPAVLAVVAGEPGASPQGCRPVTVSRIRMRPGASCSLTIRLDGPNRVTLLDPGGAGSSHPDELPEFLRNIPEVYRPPALDVDLAFLVELGGTAEAVRRRVGVVEATVRWIVERHPEPDAARFAVVGYGDHRGDALDDVTRVRTFTSGDEVLGFLAGLPVEPMRDEYYAPVEDALAAAFGRPLGWRGDTTRRALVTVGSRPPHPSSESESQCPRRLAWRNWKNRFTQHQVRMVTVWDLLPWSDRDVRVAREARQTWAALGRPTVGVGAEAVIAATGGIPGVDGRRPLLFPIILRP